MKQTTICVFAFLAVIGASAFMLIKQATVHSSWQEGYYAHVIDNALFELDLARALREGRTNNLVPSIETRMLMHASDIAREGVIDKYKGLTEHSNFLGTIADYAAKHNLFENYKGLPSHDSARRALEKYGKTTNTYVK